MADLDLFGKHFNDFVFGGDDFTSVGGVGVNTGLVDVKGFTDDVEVLTSQGWLLFDRVGEILLAEKRQWEDFRALKLSVGSAGGQLGDPGMLDRLRFSFEPLLVASVTPYVFDDSVVVKSEGEKVPGRPRGSSHDEMLRRSGGSGRVVFVQPSSFYRWDYNRETVRFKMRGVDVRVSAYADLPVKRKYREGYKFMRADKIYSNRYPEYFYLLLNRFSRDLGKEFHPARTVITDDKVRDWWWGVGSVDTFWGYREGLEKSPSASSTQAKAWFVREVARTLVPKTILPTNVFVEGRGAELYPVDGARISNGYNGSVYNLLMPPYKTVVVRKARPENKNGSPSKTTWSGAPLVMGDVSNKFVPPHGGYRRSEERMFW